MSYECAVWAAKLTLETKEKVSLLILSDAVNSETKQCWLSVSTLCQRTGLSRHTLVAALRSLESKGIIKIEQRTENGGMLSNLYTVNQDYKQDDLVTEKPKTKPQQKLKPQPALIEQPEAKPAPEKIAWVNVAASHPMPPPPPVVEAPPQASMRENHKLDDTPKKEKAPLLNAAYLVKTFGVSEKVARDWLIVRDKKRMPLTETALEKMQIEALAAGVTIQQAIELCAESGWGGFKRGYMQQNQSGGGKELNGAVQMSRGASRFAASSDEEFKKAGEIQREKMKHLPVRNDIPF